MNVLITGGAGFIGSFLSEELLKKGSSVTVLDDLSTGRMENIEHLTGNNKFHGWMFLFDERKYIFRKMNDCIHVGVIIHIASE